MFGIISYPLNFVEEYIGYTQEYLIRLAIAGQFNICTELPVGFNLCRIDNDEYIADINQEHVTGSILVKIPTEALHEYLVDKSRYISIFQSYDEPDIFYQSKYQRYLSEVSLVVVKDEMNRLSESIAAQEAIIDPSIDIPKRADLIDLVSLSKVLARRYNMTNSEAADWLSGRIKKEPEQALYDISGFTLPKRMPEAKAKNAPIYWFNKYWWEHPKNESMPMSEWNSTRVNGIAITKTDAEKYTFIPRNELEASSVGNVPLSADALGVVIRANLINLISLSRAIAKHQKMTTAEACEWVTSDIIRKQLSAYSISSIVLPRLIKSSKRADILTSCYELLAEYPDADGAEMEDFGMNANQVAISKADAEKHFSIPSNALEEFLPEKQQLYTNNTAVINEIPQINNGGVETEKLSHLSDDLITLNEAASIFWLNADPAERDTHPTKDQVSDWLESKGFSGISAKQGAVIIRPKWAAKGRR